MQDRVPYESLVRRHRTDLATRLPAFLARHRWPRERIDAERQQRLRVLLAYAKRHSPWHARRLAHVDPNTFTEADLPRIPQMTKTDLIENFDLIVTDPRVSLRMAEQHFQLLEEGTTANTYLLDEFHVLGTSGTTGRRGLVVYDWESWLIVGLSLARGRHISAMEIPPKPGARNVILAADKGWHLSVAVPQTFAPDVIVPVILPFNEIVRQLNELQPYRLTSFPSMLRQLCFAAEAGELKIAPALITSSAEQLLPETRTALEQTFRVPVFDAWACVEAGLLGHSCPKRPTAIHLIDDLSIVEPVDANGTAMSASALSAGILLTNLFNKLVPIIRYSISDTVTPLDSAVPCACGSHSRTISEIGGRSDEMFIYPGDRYVQPYVFDFLLSVEPSIIEYQVHQTLHGARILVRASAAFDSDGLARKIAEALVLQGMPEPDIVIEPVSGIARGATGKLVRFVPLKR
jgi:phenylacetate-coenzyme A ligase PaaK-like adenylate-forming protein